MQANDTQVAGTHYRTRYQHWDLVIDTGMGYFEGQVSKYVTRHRKKNGKQDVEKALHFASKAYEAAMASKISPSWDISAPLTHFDDYCESNDLTNLENVIISRVARWNSAKDWRDVKVFIQRLLALEYPDDAEAGAGYVNQDR